MKPVLFVADLHLDAAARPATLELFEEFVEQRAARAQALYILGDLFEAWIGDDDDGDTGARVAAALAPLQHAGVPAYFIHGNRDFLLGQKFADAAGLRLLADPYDLTLPEWSFVLSHGDALCLDDTAYQEFRTRVRTPEWQEKMLARPRFVRRLVARYFRWRSRNTARAVYADLNPSATDDFLRDHPEFVEIPVKELLGSERAHKLGDGQRLRLLPTPDGPDGFFAAVLRRRDGEPA